MQLWPHSARFTHPLPLHVVAQAACCVLGALIFLVEPAGAQQPQVFGQWSPIQPYDMHSVPIHMALVRGDNAPYHSRVVWWGYDAGPAGGVLGWRANAASCESFPDTLTSNPDANLIPLRPWGTTKDLFCGGQTTLADGSLLSVGGTDPHYWGLDAAVTYPPSVGSGTPGTWTSRAADERRAMVPDRHLAAGPRPGFSWHKVG